MQQPVFRDVLWAVIEVSDRQSGDAYHNVRTAHPDLTRAQFEELVEVLVRTDHLRRWRGPTDSSGGPLGAGTLMPTAKARLQFSVAVGAD
jgi:hypothetical protein